jgi:hypothetical protein
MKVSYPTKETTNLNFCNAHRHIDYLVYGRIKDNLAIFASCYFILCSRIPIVCE